MLNTVLKAFKSYLTSSNSGKSVSFSTVEVREYDRILGAHAHIPVSLSIGWEYQQIEAIPVDDYEVNGRLREEIRTIMAERCALLLKYGYSLQEMKDSEIHEEEKAVKQKHNMFGGRLRRTGLVVKFGRKVRHMIYPKN
jgi:hypothetical protein